MVVDREVIIVDHDPSWSDAYVAEARSLTELFTDTVVHVEHIGSTSIPGLGAKPIIDILLGTGQLCEIEDRIGAIERLGYVYVPEYEKVFPERRYFRKDSEGVRTHHLHGVEFERTFWFDHVLFRDHLRSHPEVAASYYQLKQELAERFRTDREKYTANKGEFIRGVLAAAKRGPLAAPD
jgi:GrpB-like predicted nucleotidyltransferase (UPF0157 family)